MKFIGSDKNSTVTAESTFKSVKTTILEGLRILVVDDSVPILKMMVKVLKQAKAIVEEAKNGKEAVDKFKICEGNFDIVLTDIQVIIKSDYFKSSYVLLLTFIYYHKL